MFMVEKDLTYHYGQVLVHIKGGVIPMNRPYLNTNTVKLLFCFCNLGGYGRIKFFFFFLNLPLPFSSPSSNQSLCLLSFTL